MSQKLYRLLGGVLAVFCLISNRVYADTPTVTVPSTPTTPGGTTTTPTTPGGTTTTPTTPGGTTTAPSGGTTVTPGVPVTPGGTAVACPPKNKPWPSTTALPSMSTIITKGSLVGSGQANGTIYKIYKNDLTGPQVNVASGYAGPEICKNPAKYGTAAYCNSSNVIFFKNWSTLPSGLSIYTGIAPNYEIYYVSAGCGDGYYKRTNPVEGYARQNSIGDLSTLCAPCYAIDYQTGHAECGFYAASLPSWSQTVQSTPNANGFHWYADFSQTGMASCRAMPIGDVATVDGTDNTGSFEVIVDGECVYSD